MITETGFVAVVSTVVKASAESPPSFFFYSPVQLQPCGRVSVSSTQQLCLRKPSAGPALWACICIVNPTTTRPDAEITGYISHVASLENLVGRGKSAVHCPARDSYRGKTQFPVAERPQAAALTNSSPAAIRAEPTGFLRHTRILTSLSVDATSMTLKTFEDTIIINFDFESKIKLKSD
ncbi:hypothetical protein RRG08_032343 [Elysia crispata]|uniref:Uncharacterized protein n=1 Tax=Elysia crispata TaxID=231223 RepID=A0AAE1A3X8_9GAST|nr:hypothetical protein RRG08_032343 [Elysia crispata]